MSKVLALYHAVFATRGRMPALHDANRLELHRYITSLVRDKDSKVIAVNSVTDHVHMLIDLSPKVSLSEFMTAVKSKSSLWLKHDRRSPLFVGWGSGYYACTVSPSMVRKTIQYIESQTEHHRIAFFAAEIKTMCQHLGLTFHTDDLC